jgi:hypothetical protein
MAWRFNPFTGNLDEVGAGSGPSPSSTVHIERFTLDSTDLTNKYVALSTAPSTAAETVLLVRDAGNMFYGPDFTVSTTHLTWIGLALDGILSVGDQLTVVYNS